MDGQSKKYLRKICISAEEMYLMIYAELYGKRFGFELT